MCANMSAKRTRVNLGCLRNTAKSAAVDCRLSLWLTDRYHALCSLIFVASGTSSLTKQTSPPWTSEPGALC